MLCLFHHKIRSAQYACVTCSACDVQRQFMHLHVHECWVFFSAQPFSLCGIVSRIPGPCGGLTSLSTCTAVQMGLHVFFGCYFNLFRLMAKCGVLENLLLKEHTHTFCNKDGDVRELDFRFIVNGTKIGAPFHGKHVASQQKCPLQETAVHCCGLQCCMPTRLQLSAKATAVVVHWPLWDQSTVANSSNHAGSHAMSLAL